MESEYILQNTIDNWTKIVCNVTAYLVQCSIY